MKYNSSYAGELYGIYLILRFLDIMWPSQTVKQGCVLIKCDNIAGMNDFSNGKLKLSRSKKILGLLRAIRNIKQKLRKRNLHILFRHIKDHQDEKLNFHQLNRWTQMNVLEDLSAKERLYKQIIQSKDIN